MKICSKCGAEHEKLGKFCSRSCANSRGPRSEEFKKQVSEKLTGKKGHDLNKGKQYTERVANKCACCGKEFTCRITAPRKYCSNACWRQQAGGYRSGSGRAKTGYYKGIYCGSTYELVWVIYNIDHAVEFSRFPGFLERNNLKYYPDFLVGNTIIELKGFEDDDSVQRKTELAESFGYSVVVKRKPQLEKEFGWVKEKYQYKAVYELYDDYKPKYKLMCAYCGTEFFRNKKPKTDIVFCGRECAGKGHKGRTPIENRRNGYSFRDAASVATWPSPK